MSGRDPAKPAMNQTDIQKEAGEMIILQPKGLFHYNTDYEKWEEGNRAGIEKNSRLLT
ncbi:MAG: hypothetical protein Q4F60_02280 [Candidatus Saccharibacteria bacterium]|nr:hypothetical protein [Candidatus Saccharibacteria bacterium]